MDLAGIGSIIGGIGSLLGGRKSSGVPDYAAIRRKAEKAGFNPAFALSQGGFSAPDRGPSFGEKLVALGGVMTEEEERRQALALAETELELRKRELDQREAEIGRQASSTILGGDTRLPTEWLGDPSGVSRPKRRPAPMSETIPVYNPSGGLTLIDKRAARRLRINAFDPVMGEDLEALYGEIGGNAFMVPHLPNAPGTTMGPSDDIIPEGDPVVGAFRGAVPSLLPPDRRGPDGRLLPKPPKAKPRPSYAPYTIEQWRKMSRAERKAAGLPVSEVGAQIYFKRLQAGF